jgi:hypothetical protein
MHERQEWEYAVFHASIAKLDEVLNLAGDDSWELVQVVPIATQLPNPEPQFRAICKRQKMAQPQPARTVPVSWG